MSFVRSLINRIVPYLEPPRVIKDPLGETVYLSRYYLIGRMPPVDANGQTVKYSRPAQPFALYLHRFHRDDPDMELHNHPWQWSVSLILAGGYLETRRVWTGGTFTVGRREFLPGMINAIFADTYHRVDLLEDDVWSLFLVGPVVQSWSFWDPETGLHTPWRVFLERKKEAANLAREVRASIAELRKAAEEKRKTAKPQGPEAL